MYNSTRLDNYYSLLQSIYGKKDVDFLVSKSKKKHCLFLNDYSENIDELIRYHRTLSEVCSECNDYFKNGEQKTIYGKRIIEFPSWAPGSPLCFEGDSPVKKLMVIGIDPGPKIRTDLHTSYELGMHKINPDGSYNVDLIRLIIKKLKGEIPGIERLNEQVNNTARTPYLKYLMMLFNNDLNFILVNIYNTDTCKCLDKKDNLKVMFHCYSTYLFNEIKFIKPKVIIVQGDDSYEALKCLAKKFENLVLEKDEVDKKYYINDKFPKYGKLRLDNRDCIRYVKIYHTAIGNPRPWHDIERINKYKALFKNVIWPELDFSPN